MDAFGVVGFFCVLMYYPFQIYKTYITKRVDDFSVHSLWQLSIGAFLLTISSIIFVKYLVFIIGNFLATIGATTLLCMYYTYRSKSNDKRDRDGHSRIK